MQFDCGPRAKPLPDDETLKTWTSRDILEEYKEAWKWGARCDGLLLKNKTYFDQSLKERETVTKEISK